MKDLLISDDTFANEIRKGMSNLSAVTYVVEEACPSCGGEMVAWRIPKYKRDINGRLVKDSNGKLIPNGPRCGPVCTVCKYKKMLVREDGMVQDKYFESLRRSAIAHMRKNSVFTNDTIWTKNFENYKAMDEETGLAKQKAKAFVEDLVKIPDAHVVFSGKTGVGKTHLSMAIVYEFMKIKKYKVQCLMISYRELLEQLRFAMNDEETKKAVTGEVMRDIKAVDLVVIDDLGAQLGNPLSPNIPSNFDIDTITSLAEAREGKATIVTMNLTSKVIKGLYGERLYSRIASNVGDRYMVFSKTADKRISGI